MVGVARVVVAGGNWMKSLKKLPSSGSSLLCNQDRQILLCVTAANTFGYLGDKSWFNNVTNPWKGNPLIALTAILVVV